MIRALRLLRATGFALAGYNWSTHDTTGCTWHSGHLLVEMLSRCCLSGPNCSIYHDKIPYIDTL